MNKYYQILGKVLSSGKMQSNKKGNIRYLLNEQLTLLPADLLDIFEGHTIARKKLKNELQLFMRGERNVEKYREVGINWWDYSGKRVTTVYEGRTKRGKIQGGRNQLVGLLRLYPCEQLPNLF